MSKKPGLSSGFLTTKKQDLGMNDLEFRCDKVNEDITLIQRKCGLTFGSDAYLLYAYM